MIIDKLKALCHSQATACIAPQTFRTADAQCAPERQARRPEEGVLDEKIMVNSFRIGDSARCHWRRAFSGPANEKGGAAGAAVDGLLLRELL